MPKFKTSHLLSVLVALACGNAIAQTNNNDVEDVLVITAAEQTRQALGVSTITSSDIRKTPPRNDLSEVIRTMPGVNLTGNSTSGQRGNNRQIDIRGMGPENTLILIDGRPVKSRMSVRYGWRGERDTRGDTNWVPANLVERIDVLRGPAAARFGDGAAGGVVNIITKQPTGELHGALNSYIDFPQSSKEGSTKRTDFSLFGGLTDDVSFRLYGNVSKTGADDWDINKGHEIDSSKLPAGREGVRNRDLNGLIRWDISEHQSLDFEAGFSRQGNIYAGDTQNNNSNPIVQSKYNQETNRMYRQNYAITHRGYWDNGANSLSYIQYEQTRNDRFNEGLAGGTEGIFDTTKQFNSTARFNNLTLHNEINIPLDIVVPQMLTVGTEYNYQKLNDLISNTQKVDNSTGGTISGSDSLNRSSKSSANSYAFFVENNIELTQTTMLTPALRFDHHSISGSNWSPALNLSQELGDYFTLKLGIARAYKSPNLYQSNPNYILWSKGQGCYGINDKNGCYLIGNEDLNAETSVNKEIGLEFHNNEGLTAGITYFRNDYHNKIESGTKPIGNASGGAGAYIFQWENVPKAVVEGLEGSLVVPVTDRINWRNSLTWMLQSKNKQTGDYLSIIPEFTLNSSVSWQATDQLSILSSVTWYGQQKPKKYDFNGDRLTDSSTTQLSPYSIVNFSGQYQFSKNFALTAGVNNLFDKRLFRRGNAASLKDPSTGTVNVYGAGAATYNEPGRTFFISTNISF